MKTSLLLLAALAFTGCGGFSKTDRQQRAYAKYVRKSSMGRVKQQAKFRSDKPAMPIQQAPPSEPVESTETAPQSVPSDG